MKDKGSQAGWGFWLKWVVATTVGLFVGSHHGHLVSRFTHHRWPPRIIELGMAREPILFEPRMAHRLWNWL